MNSTHAIQGAIIFTPTIFCMNFLITALSFLLPRTYVFQLPRVSVRHFDCHMFTKRFMLFLLNFILSDCALTSFSSMSSCSSFSLQRAKRRQVIMTLEMVG